MPSSAHGCRWSPSAHRQLHLETAGRVRPAGSVRAQPIRSCHSIGSPAMSASAAATSSDTMGCIRAGGSRTVCPSVADWAMPHELEELRCADDRVRNRGSLDQIFLSHLRAEVTTRRAGDRCRRPTAPRDVPRPRLLPRRGGCDPTFRRTPKQPCPRTRASSPRHTT